MMASDNWSWVWTKVLEASHFAMTADINFNVDVNIFSTSSCSTNSKIISPNYAVVSISSKFEL